MCKAGAHLCFKLRLLGVCPRKGGKASEGVSRERGGKLRKGVPGKREKHHKGMAREGGGGEEAASERDLVPEHQARETLHSRYIKHFSRIFLCNLPPIITY